MKRFGYLRDRLFLATSSLYAINRWLIKPHVHNPFMRFHFNDLLLIPCALPPLLLIQRLLRLRDHDEPPSLAEIGLYTILWSVLFEVIGPHFVHRATGDPLDAAMYVCGAVAAAFWWHRHRLQPRISHEL